MEKPVVFVVEDDAAVRQGIILVLQTMDVEVEPYGSVETFLAGYDRSKWGCLVLDLKLPGLSGLELQAHLAREKIGLPIIFITGHGDIPAAVEACKLGAVDFLEKPFHNEVLRDRVTHALTLALDHFKKTSEAEVLALRIAQLTPRERGLLKLLMTGKPSKVMALELGISQKTVDFHRVHILEKMGVDTQTELVIRLGKFEFSETDGVV